MAGDFRMEGDTLVKYTGTDTVVHVPAGVKAIGKCCFKGLPVEQVILPDGLKSIGDGAFSECRALVSVKIPKSVNYFGKCVFMHCTALKKITLPAVAHISYRCFYHCNSLEMLALPEGVVSIGIQAFRACLALKTITFPSTLRSIEEKAFDSCSIEELTLPDGFERLGEAAFSGCAQLRRVTIPDSVSDLGVETFDMCQSLEPENVKVPLTEHGTGIFTDCNFVAAGYCERCAAKMESDGKVYTCPRCKAWFNIKYFTEPHGRFAEAVAAGAPEYLHISGGKLTGFTGEGSRFEVPDCVTKLGEGCLTGKPFEAVILPDSVTEIGARALADCSRLTDITIPESVAVIGSEAFAGTPWLHAKQQENPIVIVNGILIDGTACTGAVFIPDGVKSIADAAFRDNKTVTSVFVPDSTVLIGDAVFDGCDALQAVSLPARFDSDERFGGAPFTVRENAQD